MSQNEKKGTRREAYSAQKVVRRSPPCWTGDNGLGISDAVNGYFVRTHPPILLYMYSSSDFIVLILRFYCTHPPILLYSSSDFIVLILRFYCTHPLILFHSWCISVLLFILCSRHDNGRGINTPYIRFGENRRIRKKQLFTRARAFWRVSIFVYVYVCFFSLLYSLIARKTKQAFWIHLTA